MSDTTPTAPPKAPSSAKATASKRTSAGASKARTARASAARTRGASKSKPTGTRAGGGAPRRGPAARANSTRSTTDLVGDYAERAVLIPVGAALLARERVVSSVSDAISTYSSPSKTQSQLRKFEHRGSAARTRMEREVRKTRTRVERELRERRRELDKRRVRLTKEVTSRVEQTQSQLEKTQAQIEDAVRTRLEEGADLASRVQERVLNLV
jgi:C4-dicarboxylate-specific signal transduction histidine kinase